MRISFVSGFLGLAIAACVGDRGPLGGPGDGGMDGKEAGPDATDLCHSAPPDKNELSFDIDCARCGKSHIAMTVDRKSTNYPACAEGNGNFEFGPCNHQGMCLSLTGNEASQLQLDIVNYVGPGDYTLQAEGSAVLSFDLGATLSCADSGFDPMDTIQCIIQGGMTGPSDAGAPPSCKVHVDSDCVNDADGAQGTHTVKGTLECTLEDACGDHCTITGGTFNFGGCVF